jgi:ParB-like chromosome segregation protein Spo0J
MSKRKKASAPPARKGRKQKSKTKDTATDVRHSNRVYKPHSIALTFPSLSDLELQELMQDIAKHGQREAITLYKDEILDGVHRYRACRQIGVIPFYREFKGDLEAAVAYARSLNHHRRHMTAEQRREAAELQRKLIADLIKAEPELSSRQISEKAGVHHSAVDRERKRMEKSGDVAHAPHRQDSLGRQQPARKPTKAEQHLVEVEFESEDEVEAEDEAPETEMEAKAEVPKLDAALRSKFYLGVSVLTSKEDRIAEVRGLMRVLGLSIGDFDAAPGEAANVISEKRGE